MARAIRLPLPAAVLATLAAATLWGTSFNANDAGLRHVDPLTFVFLRFLLAAVLVLAVLAALGKLDWGMPRHSWLWMLAALNTVAFVLQYYGQVFTTPARTALFVNTSAFFVALIERVFLGARVGPRRMLAIATGLLGASLLVVGGDFSTLRGAPLLGDLLAMGTGLAWAAYAVLNRTAVRREDPFSVTGWTFALTALMVAPAALWQAQVFSVPAAGWMAIVYTGVATTAFAFGLWALGLTGLRASTSTILLLFEILVAAVVSVALLKREAFSAWETAGALLLVAAVVLMTIASRDEDTGSDAT